MSPEGRRTLDGDRLADVLDEVAVCLYVKDRDGRFLYLNRATVDALGGERDAILGTRAEDLIGEQEAARWAEQDQQLIATGAPLDDEETLGGRVHVTHKVPLLDRDGRPAAVIGVSTDITRRKQHEERLRRSERRLAEAQQIAGLGSWHWDAVEGELTWSTELCRLYGVSPEQAPTGEEALGLVHEDDRERVRAASDAALAGGAPMDLDMRIVRPDGEIRVLHCRGGVTIGPDGSPTRLDGTCIDVTDHRRARSGGSRRRSGSRRSAPSTGTSTATRSRGRRRCTGSSASTPRASSPRGPR